MLISVGELNKNKNNQVIIKALGKLKDNSIHYVLCGIGNKNVKLKTLAQNCGIANNVHFLGYRTDVNDLMNASDIFVMPSLREGLSRSIMEAMASGLPCVVSKIRGNMDLVKDGECGYLVKADDVDGFAEKLRVLASDMSIRNQMSRQSLIRIKNFDIVKVKEIIAEIYREELGY